MEQELFEARMPTLTEIQDRFPGWDWAEFPLYEEGMTEAEVPEGLRGTYHWRNKEHYQGWQGKSKFPGLPDGTTAEIWVGRNPYHREPTYSRRLYTDVSIGANISHGGQVFLIADTYEDRLNDDTWEGIWPHLPQVLNSFKENWAKAVEMKNWLENWTPPKGRRVSHWEIDGVGGVAAVAGPRAADPETGQVLVAGHGMCLRVSDGEYGSVVCTSFEYMDWGMRGSLVPSGEVVVQRRTKKDVFVTVPGFEKPRAIANAISGSANLTGWLLKI